MRSAAGRADRRGRTRRVLLELLLLHLAHVPFHFQAGQPLDVARQVDPGPQASPDVGGRERPAVLDDLLARPLLRFQAGVDTLVGRDAAQEADHDGGRIAAGFADIDRRHEPLLRCEGGEPLAGLAGMGLVAGRGKIGVVRAGGADTRGIAPGLLVGVHPRLRFKLGDPSASDAGMRAGAILLEVGFECIDSAGLGGVGPGLVVILPLARVVLGRRYAAARLGGMGSGGEALQVAGESRRRAGTQRIGPGLVVRRLLPRLRVECGKTGARLLRVRAGAVALQVGVECRAGAGLRSDRPGFLVGILARLIEGRDTRARLTAMRAVAVLLEVLVERRRGAGLRRLGPGLLLVRRQRRRLRLARLAGGRRLALRLRLGLLLRPGLLGRSHGGLGGGLLRRRFLPRRLLRLRLLAATGHQGRPCNGCNDHARGNHLDAPRFRCPRDCPQACPRGRIYELSPANMALRPYSDASEPAKN